MARFKPSVAAHGTIVEWAEGNLRIPASEARAGRLRLFPYQRDILRAYTDGESGQVTLQLPAQSGKTWAVLAMAMFSIVNDPCVMMSVNARADDSAKLVRNKIIPAIESNPIIRSRIRRAGISQKSIPFEGGELVFGHSGSDASMRSTSAKAVFADELDVWEIGVDADDPLDVLRQRTTTFGKAAKLVVLSTPTDKDASVIAREYDDGSRGKFVVPCGACGHWQALGDENVVEGALDYLACVGCGVRIGERERLSMIASGKWRHAEPRNPNRSFHMTQYSSPMASLELTLSRKAKYTRRGYVCQVLALPYEMGAGESLRADQAAGLYANEMPFVRVARDGGATVGVDVQGDRIEYSLVAWHMGDDGRQLAHIMEHRALPYRKGDALDFKAAFAALWNRLRTERTDCVFVDGKWKTGEVWGVVKTAPAFIRRRVFVSQGHEDRSRAFIGDDFIMERPERAYNAKWYRIQTDAAKTFAHEMAREGRLSVQRDGVPGNWHEMFTAEQIRMVRVGRTFKPAWVNVGRNKRNEALDCFVYACSARRKVEADWIKAPKIDIVGGDSGS